MVLGNPTITFTPAANFSGQASFTYTVCDNGTPSQCAGAKVTVTVQPPLIVGNSAAFGGGPIATFDFATGATVGYFVPTGAFDNNNGRGVAVRDNEVFYTELTNGFGPTDFIRVAPFNGGAGGSDTRAIPNPRPGTGIQDLAFFGPVLYVLTGYPSSPLQVFRLDPVTGNVLSAPVAIAGPASPDSDGFTVLPNGNFLINNFDTSCTYNQYHPTGALIPGTTIIVPDGNQCTGVDTDGVALYFQRNFNSLVQTDMAGNFIASKPVAAASPGCTGGAMTQCIEDISLVK